MNQFNTQFNPYFRQQFYQPAVQTGIVWVQGIEGAKAYQLAPNSNAQLLDSENEGIFYIKVSDSVGMCTLRKFKYVEVTTETTESAPDLSEYVKRDELQEILAKLTTKETRDEQPVSTTKSKWILE